MLAVSVQHGTLLVHSCCACWWLGGGTAKGFLLVGRCCLTKQDLVGTVDDQEGPALFAGHNELAARALTGGAGLVDDVGRHGAGRVDVLVDDRIAVLRGGCGGAVSAPGLGETQSSGWLQPSWEQHWSACAQPLLAPTCT